MLFEVTLGALLLKTFCFSDIQRRIEDGVCDFRHLYLRQTFFLSASRKNEQEKGAYDKNAARFEPFVHGVTSLFKR